MLAQGEEVADIIKAHSDILCLAELCEKHNKFQAAPTSESSSSLPPVDKGSPQTTPQSPSKHSQLGFGKYAEQTWATLLQTDPAYIRWVKTNTDRKIPDDVLQQLDNANPSANPSAIKTKPTFTEESSDPWDYNRDIPF